MCVRDREGKSQGARVRGRARVECSGEGRDGKAGGSESKREMMEDREVRKDRQKDRQTDRQTESVRDGMRVWQSESEGSGQGRVS